MKIRLIIVAVIIVIWVIAAILLSQFGPERKAGELPAALRTAKPTFTATATPTATLPPSPTPTPTSTHTPAPTATNTPPPTDTPLPSPTPTETATPLPTNTPTAAPTSTPRPSSPPTQTPTLAPTSTPSLPFAGQVAGGSPNCGTMGVWGYVWDKSSSPYPGVTVGVWTDGWAGRVSGPADKEGKYTVVLSDLPPGEFIAAVVDLNTCATRDGVPEADRCDRLSEPIRVTLFSIDECTSEGTVQWAEVHFSAR